MRDSGVSKTPLRQRLKAPCRPLRCLLRSLRFVALSTEQLLVTVLVRSAIPQGDDMINFGAWPAYPIAPALLADAAVALADSVSVFYAGATTLALDGADSSGCDRLEAATDGLNTRLQHLQFGSGFGCHVAFQRSFFVHVYGCEGIQSVSAVQLPENDPGVAVFLIHTKKFSIRGCAQKESLSVPAIHAVEIRCRPASFRLRVDSIGY